MKRIRILLFVLVLCAAPVVTVHAQYADGAGDNAEARLFREPSGFSLDKLFSPEYFRMSHSYELSYSSFGGHGLSLGEYTNTMMWRFSTKLAARVDVGVQHTPFGLSGLNNGLPASQDNLNRIYLKNAEVAYRPVGNLTMHLSVRQAPYRYGYYLSPYGRYGYDRYGIPLGYEDRYFNSWLH
jgi:hypothetical protein